MSTVFDVKPFLGLAKTIKQVSADAFGRLDISLDDLIETLPFGLVSETVNGYDVSRHLSLRVGMSSYIDMYYSYEDREMEDDYSFVDKTSGREFFSTEKTGRLSVENTQLLCVRFIDSIFPFLKEAVMATYAPQPVVSSLLTQSSYSCKKIGEIAQAMKLPHKDVVIELSRICKTMIGREQVIDILLDVSISVYMEDTGYQYTPDMLLKDIVEYMSTPTFSGPSLKQALRQIWDNVAPTLKEHPKGHRLIKEILITLAQELGSKNSTGVKQVRELLKLSALEEYYKLS